MEASDVRKLSQVRAPLSLGVSGNALPKRPEIAVDEQTYVRVAFGVTDSFGWVRTRANVIALLRPVDSRRERA